MRTDRLQRVIEVMEMVKDDTEKEALGIDGHLFDGRYVGEQLGNMLAEISACATGVKECAAALLEVAEDLS